MSNNPTNFREGTDLNEVKPQAEESVQEQKISSNTEKFSLKLTRKEKAAAVLGQLLLGGSAFVAVGQIDGEVVEPVVSRVDSTLQNGVDQLVIGDSLQPQEITVGSTLPVFGGTICPTEEVQIVNGVNESMSFSEAFATAREEVGPGGIFNWHGATYNTFFKEEWNQLGLAEKQGFLHDVGYRISLQTEVEVVDDKIDPVIDVESAEDYLDLDLLSGDVKETISDGRLSYVFDLDKDGISDLIIMADDENNGTELWLNRFGEDDYLDTHVIMDSASDLIYYEVIDEPFYIHMEDVVGPDERREFLVDGTDIETLEVEHEAGFEEDLDDLERVAAASSDYSNGDDVGDLV